MREQRDLVAILLDDMLGLGPLEPLLADESVSDIMVNKQESKMYCTKNGVRLNQNFNRSAHGSKMYKETDRLYFATQLIEQLAKVVEVPKGSSTR